MALSASPPHFQTTTAPGASRRGPAPGAGETRGDRRQPLQPGHTDGHRPRVAEGHLRRDFPQQLLRPQPGGRDQAGKVTLNPEDVKLVLKR